jgi:hypothetical protein
VAAQSAAHRKHPNEQGHGDQVEPPLSSNPTISCAVGKEQAYSQLKQRICKFSTEGNAVTYKFKKSLLVLEKRRMHQE